MKALINSTKNFNKVQMENWKRITCFSLITLMVITACKKNDTIEPADKLQAVNNEQITKDSLLNANEGITLKTIKQLTETRIATARYKDINNAILDGYEDISVIVPNMGYHYMNSGILDSLFEADKPEMLVYNKLEDESLELVAVEYAVPLDYSPNMPPTGFSGTADFWFRDTVFNLWTLHAWIWKFNPSGVFNPTNPNVEVHDHE